MATEPQGNMIEGSMMAMLNVKMWQMQDGQQLWAYKSALNTPHMQTAHPSIHFSHSAYQPYLLSAAESVCSTPVHFVVTYVYCHLDAMRSLAGQRSVGQCSGRESKASTPVVRSRPPQPVANSQPAVAVNSQSVRHGYSDAVLLQGWCFVCSLDISSN